MNGRSMSERSFDQARLSIRVPLADLMDALPDGIVVVDANGRIAFANARLEQLAGYRRDELRDCPLEVLVPERLRGSHELHRQGYTSAPHLRSMGSGLGIRLLRSDGAEIRVDIQLSPLDIAGMQLTVAAVREISDRAMPVASTATQAGSQGTIADWDRFRQLLQEIDALTEKIGLRAPGPDSTS